MTISYNSIYISAATNRSSHAADISPESLVCFGCESLLAFWDASDPRCSGVFRTCRGHKKNITCVKWIGNDFLISGDEEGIIQVRRKTSEEWLLIINHQAHERGKPITILTAYNDIIITGSSDANIKIWKLSKDADPAGSESTLSYVQTLTMKGRYPLDVELSVFPGTPCLFLAVSSTSKDIDIWTGSTSTSSPFIHTASLSGHEDWVKALSFQFIQSSPSHLVLASGSQDGTIRLWTICETISHLSSQNDIFDQFEASLGQFNEEDGTREISAKRHLITAKPTPDRKYYFSLTFDALLVGHEAGITSLSWLKFSAPSKNVALLSTSIDSSLIIWSPSSQEETSSSLIPASIWVTQQRFGDVGGQRFGGFVGGFWSVDGTEVMAWGWNGGWRRWRRIMASKESWEEIGALTGHQGVVRSVAWAQHGDYLISSGVDQTTRIHGPVHNNSTDVGQKDVWRELARPQVHGYDVVDVNFISPLRFASIADEKVTRIFDAPRNFVAMTNSLGIIKVPLVDDSRPASANVPPLGLSNKAADSSALDAPTPGHAQRYPFEGELASVTLWPEIEKIFGHGYELISLAVSPSGSYLATACKSTTAEHAVVRLYDSQNWSLVGRPLAGHKLTVTRMCFSSDSRLLLSVSRDRTWRLFKLNDNVDEGYFHVASSKAHERIIWDCAWVKEPSELMFATASRDKTVKIWQGTPADIYDWKNVATLIFKEAVTAIDFCHLLLDGRRRLAIGFEFGDILIYSQKASDDKTPWTLECTIARGSGHTQSVLRVSWRPSNNQGSIQHLASCGEDGTTRITEVHISFN